MFHIFIYHIIADERYLRKNWLFMKLFLCSRELCSRVPQAYNKLSVDSLCYKNACLMSLVYKNLDGAKYDAQLP